MIRWLLIAGAALALAGCTMSQEVRGQCLAMGFEPGSDKLADCQMRLTEAAMSSPRYGGGAPIMPPPVTFQPLQMPQRYGSPTVRVQANCSSYGMGRYVNTNCY